MSTTTQARSFFCSVCQLDFGGSAKEYVYHVMEEEHKRRKIAQTPSTTHPSSSHPLLPPPHAQTSQSPKPSKKKTKTKVTCPACNTVVAGRQDGWEGHIRGASHKSQAAKIPNYVEPHYDSLSKIRKPPQPNPVPVPVPVPAPAPSNQEQLSSCTCAACDKVMPLSSWADHLQGKKHWKRVIRKRASPTFTLPDNLDPTTRLCVECLLILPVIDWPEHVQSDPHLSNADDGASVSSGSSNATISPERLTRATKPKAATPVVQQPVQATRPNKGAQAGGRVRKVWNKKGGRVLIPGVAAPHLEGFPWVKKMRPFLIPDDIEEIFSSEKSRFKEELDAISQRVAVPLSQPMYEQSWKTLLFAEEIQMKDDLSRYDMHDVTFVQHGLYYHLEVPGLAEKRPSVLVGDTFSVRACGAPPNSPSYEGHVHYVYQKEVGLRFDKRFQARSGQTFDVEFQLNRVTVRRMHEAISIPMKGGERRRILFPDVHRLNSILPITPKHLNSLKATIVNTAILNNPQQMIAVAAIKERPPSSPPLIVWGPPGTGKTITAVEGIRQILLKDPDAYILACAPSNSAADLIAQRLLDLGKDSLFRLNAPSRPASLLPPELRPFTRTTQLKSKYPADSPYHQQSKGGYEIFSCPSKEAVMKFNVIVSTCNLAGVPFGIGVPPGHFSHIFIDEAGQALEPEIMIPIKTMLVDKTNLILCGDPKQLGPIVHSPIAKRLGLATSYLERLVNLPGYNLDSAKPGVSIVRLTQNFRSHPSILKFPSDEFYDGEVQPFGRPDVINALLKWKGLPKTGFPIIFHAVKGTNLQEPTSPSYYNLEEAKVVKEYVDKLRGIGLSYSHVGIIAPYRAQCRKIREELKQSKLSEERYKVGSVEEFQGQERKAIIVSTVRTNQALASDYDKKHSLGFVAQERRFNVAVTRAQALLVLVGDPGVLRLDRVWWSFMNYVYLNGGWCGAPIEWDPNGEFDVARPPANEGGTGGLPDDDEEYPPPPADLPVTWSQHRE